MATTTLKVARIGNSRGVRLPAAVLQRYRIGETVLMEEIREGILLRPSGQVVEKLSWEETTKEMAASGEDWTDWDATSADGLAGVPWETGETGNSPKAASRVASRKKAPAKKRP